MISESGAALEIYRADLSRHEFGSGIRKDVGLASPWLAYRTRKAQPLLARDMGETRAFRA